MRFVKSLQLPERQQALPGRPQAVNVPEAHQVLGHPLQGPFAPHLCQALFGLGCFWGAERLFWQQPGVFTTAVGYAGGYTPNPWYEEVCSGLTAHAEVVLVVYDPARVQYGRLLQLFWESHDPTQGMAQGNDRGTQYRSTIYSFDQSQYNLALRSRDAYQQALASAGRGTITTEIKAAAEFYYAEAEHQQYLAKHPAGYCGLAGTGVKLPVDY